MQIQGHALFSVLGSLQQPAPGGGAQAPHKPQAPKPQGGAPNTPKPETARPETAKPAAEAQPAQSTGTSASAGAARTQELEEAVRSLSDRGSLPPRGSLVDLRA